MADAGGLRLGTAPVSVSLASLTAHHSMASDSAIGPNWFTVVNWNMGAGAPLSGVILTGGSDGRGFLCGVLTHPSSMWFILPFCRSADSRLRPAALLSVSSCVIKCLELLNVKHKHNLKFQ